jgi:hypothetical protein
MTYRGLPAPNLGVERRMSEVGLHAVFNTVSLLFNGQ